MKDCTILTGTISISDLPFLKDYEEVKKQLSIRFVNRMKIKPEAVYKLYLDFGVTCHIDVSDLVGDDATCMVKRGLMEYMGVEKDRLFADAIENSMKIRPAVAVPIEDYMGHMGFPMFEGEHRLMIATTEKLMYGAGVILYPGFLERISGGKSLFLIPSSVHEWLYLENDSGEFTGEELTDLLRVVNKDVVAEDEVLGDTVYYYDGKGMRRA